MSRKKLSSIHAKTLSDLGASRGGHARANVLSAEERKEIARNAVKARWAKVKGVPISQIGQVSESPEKTLPVATEPVPTMAVSLFQGTLEMGGMNFTCHVLNNHKRVIVTREIVRALTGTIGGNLKGYLATANIRKHIDPEILTKNTITFKIPGTQYEANGYEATVLVEICDAYLKARDEGNLTSIQRKLAKQAEIIMRASAKVGIIALIDEATGFQKIRAENALRLKLQAFIAEDMQEWARMFPNEFFFELARLENIHYSPRNRPIRWGKYILTFVYRAVDPDVTNELKKRTPNPHKGENLHQWLQEFGREKVTAQIHQVIGMMKSCKTIDEFKEKFNKAYNPDPFEQLTFFDLAETYQN